MENELKHNMFYYIVLLDFHIILSAEANMQKKSII